MCYQLTGLTPSVRANTFCSSSQSRLLWLNYDQGVVMWSGSARAGELLQVLADFALTTASSV